jgi:methionine-rich copper-binding protein CopC
MHVPRSFPLRVLAAAVLVGAVSLLAAPPASAHNSLVSSEPAASSTVTALPTEVVLHFEEAPLAGGSAIVVRGPSGTSVTAGKAVISGSDVTVELETLTETGTYTVAWRSVADDGHPGTGTFTFTVPESLLPNATPIDTATATPSPSTSVPATSAASASSVAAGSDGSSSSGGGALPWVLGGVAVLVVVGSVVALVRRRSA